MSSRLIKRLISGALALTLVFSINGFAAVVTDSDGSAFITKAEFDSLKNSFQAQIDSYNQAIDSKIDGAIASYLAGIRISTTAVNPFFDGNGSRVLIAKLENINDLKRGYCGMDWLSIAGTAGVKTGCSNIMWMINMKRVVSNATNKSFEIFKVKDGKLEYYENNWNFTATATLSHQGMTTPGTFTMPSSTNIRWHGNHRASASNVPALSNTQTDFNREYYSDIFGNKNFMLMWGAGMNIGSISGTEGEAYWNVNQNPWSTVRNLRKQIYNTSLTVNKGTDVNLVMDTSTQSAHIFCDGDLDVNKLRASWLEGYKNVNYTWDLPSDNHIAPISTEGWVLLNNNNSDTTGRYKLSTTINWTKEKGALGQSGEYSWHPWFELAPMLDSFLPSNIKNNLTESVLTKYAPYGYSGKMTQGVPVGIFKDSGTISFGLDLSPLSDITSPLNVAFSTTPFAFTATEGIEDTSAVGISNLKIDGDSLTTGKTVFTDVTKTNHHISFDFDFDFAGETPIYMHIGFNKSYTGSERGLINLPLQYTLVQK